MVPSVARSMTHLNLSPGCQQLCHAAAPTIDMKRNGEIVMKSKALGLLAAALMGVSGVALSTPVTWEVPGVTFSNGSTASGSFEYDASTKVYSNISIITTGPLAFTFPDVYALSSTYVDLCSAACGTAGAGFIQLVFVNPLTGAGGVDTIGHNIYDPFLSTYTGVGLNLGTAYDVTGGRTLVSVPLPATLLLLLSSLAGVGLLGRRKLS
jgi:hypothetical protein